MSPAGITLVLSGGGAKSAAHIGAALALAEAGLMPVRYIAASMGAVIAVALAARLDPESLLARLAEVGRTGVVKDPLAFMSGLYTRSLLRPRPFREAIERLVPVRRFADLAVPVTVTVTHLDLGEQLLFGDGGEDAPLVDVLCATCALPVYYPPVLLGGRRCGDGGLRGPLPLDVAARFARETVVAVDVGPGFDVQEPGASAGAPAPCFWSPRSSAAGRCPRPPRHRLRRLRPAILSPRRRRRPFLLRFSGRSCRSRSAATSGSSPRPSAPTPT